MNVSINIKTFRQNFGLSLMDVAVQAGMLQADVAAIENASSDTPCRETVRQRVIDAIRALACPDLVLTETTRTELAAIFARHGASDVRVFGSVAKRTARPGSDLDLIAKFPSGFGLFKLFALQDELEDLIGIRVDLVSDDPREQSPILDAIRATATPLIT